MRKHPSLGWHTFCPDAYCPLLTLSDASCPIKVTSLKRCVLNLGVHHAKLLDHITDLNRDYLGRFFDPEEGFLDLQTGKFREVFVDLDPLEEAPVEWWRDNFGPAVATNPIIRVRCEAQSRWQALGSVYFAWHPWERVTWCREVANDNHAPASK